MSWLRTFLIGAAACTAFSAQAGTVDVVTNGNFTSLNGWTQSISTNGNSSGTCSFNAVTAPGTETLTNTAGFPTTTGTTAVLGSVSVTAVGYYTCVLYQDIVIPAGATSATLTADVGRKVTGEQDASNSTIRIGLYPATSVPYWNDAPSFGNNSKIQTGGSVTAVLTPSTTSPASFTISGDKIGQTYRLAIINAAQSAAGGTGAPPASGSAIAGVNNLKLLFTTDSLFTLTVAKAGAGTGTVTTDLGGIACGATCTGDYAVGATVTLTATADEGSSFSGWSGACSGAAATTSVTMSQARDCTATFTLGSTPAPTPPPAPAIPEVPVTVDTTGSGQGTVSLQQALSSVPADTPITVQQTSGAALPSWLTFDATTRSFTYNVPLPDDLPIQPVAGDAADARTAKAGRPVVPNRVYPLSVLVQSVPVLLTAGSVQYIVNMDFYAPRAPVAMTAVSYSAAGRSGNAMSGKPALSWDGGQVLFETAATNLFPAFSDYTMVGRYHGLSGNRDLLSQTAIPGGGVANAADGPATAPAVSANGAYGAFAAAAVAVSFDPTSRLRQVYRTPLAYPRVPLNEAATPAPVMVSTTAANVPADAAADKPSLSQDGRFVAFESAATNLGSNADGAMQVWRKDMADGSVRMISASAEGEAGNGESRNVSLSWDGRFAAFDSTATNLVPGMSGRQVYLKDLQTGAIIVASAKAGVAGNEPSVAPKLDARADSLVFASQATNLGSGGNRYWQVWRFDVATGALTLISATPTGAAGNQDSDQPTISADGRFVAWRSAATDIQTGYAGNGFTQIWVRDLMRGATALVTQTDAGVAGAGNSYDPALSGDGASLAFGSQARDLVNGTPQPGQIHVAGNPLVLPGRTAHWYVPTGGNQAWAIERWGNTAYVANLAYDADGGAGTWVSGLCTFTGLGCVGTLNQVTGGAPVKASAAPVGSFAMTYAPDGTSAEVSIANAPSYPLRLYPVLGPSTDAFAGLPQQGWWYESAAPGSANGVFLQFDTQTGTNGTINQTAHLSILSYDDRGHPVWYAAEGVLGRDLSLEGTLYSYAGGAPVGQTTGGAVPTATSVGTFRLTFATGDQASLHLPGGRAANLSRYRF